MQKQKRSNRTVEVLIGFGIFFTLLFAFSDMVSNAKYQMRGKLCRKNLQSIGIAMTVFRTAQHGKMPPNLVALSKNLPNKYVPCCPLSGAGYAYRHMQNPVPSDVVCWDAYFQRPDHSILFWLSMPSRNVLTVNGKVETLPEEQFQALHSPATSP